MLPGRSVDDGEVDRMLAGVADDLLPRRAVPQRQLHAEPLLILDGDAAGQAFAGLVLDRLVHFRQPVGAHFGGPPRGKRILQCVDDVQPRAERISELPREHDGPVERLIHPAVQQDLPHRCAGHRTSSFHSMRWTRAAAAGRTRRAWYTSPTPLTGHHMESRWAPALLRSLPGYSRQAFVGDLIAGITVGLVALPLAMAFAIASGLTPQAGIYCAIVTGFLISALGGSRCQIGGPTGAFVVVVAGIIAEHGVSGLYVCTMMAGVILIVLGLTGSGSAVRFIPRPVVVGFTNGIAVLIASTQIRDFLGLRMAENPGEFIGRM